MRILSWVQSKINGKHEKKPEPVYSSAARYTSKEEFSDWPHGLLAIGTFGNCNLKGDRQQKENAPATPRPSLELQDFDVEEVDKLQKELARLLAAYQKSETAEVGKSKSRNKPSGLEIDVTTCRKNTGDTGDGDGGEPSPNSRIILNGDKDMFAENRSALNQRSFSFLFKRMLACRSGFAPAPSLRDPLQASIMEKLLNAIVHKKIYPQNSTPISTRKYLEKKPVGEKGTEDKTQAKASNGSKWVKTDSEYIVLEI